jgi:hypothetical protein
MSTQIEEGNKEGVKDPDDNLIDFLIDDVHFDDLLHFEIIMLSM